MGKFHRQADRSGEWLGSLFNRNIRETLKVGVHVLVENTRMDSGRAAAHWMVIPNKGGSPGSYSQMKFPNPDHGTKPVGHPGDSLSDRGQTAGVVKAITDREWSRSINKSVRGRKPATRFLFRSSVPEEFESGPVAVGNYRDNARLEEAKQAATSRMNQKFHALLEAGNHRVRPLR